MTYHKRPMEQRKCAHCKAKFLASHKSRLYCSQSCNTLAWRARQQAQTASVAEPTGQKEQVSKTTLELSAQNVGMLALGSALGTVAVQGTTALLQGGSDLDLLRAEIRQLRQEVRALHEGAQARLSVLALLPEELRTATAPLVSLRVGQDTVQVVRVEFHGQVLYHHEGRQLLLWEQKPGVYHALNKAEQLTQLAAFAARQPRKAKPHALPPREETDMLWANLGAELQAETAWNEAANSAADEQFRAIFQADAPKLPVV
jgi:ribosomal protein S27AE